MNKPVFISRVRASSQGHPVGSLLGNKEISFIHDSHLRQSFQSKERLKTQIKQQLRRDNLIDDEHGSNYVNRILDKELKKVKDPTAPSEQLRSYTKIERLLRLQRTKLSQEQATLSFVQRTKEITKQKQDLDAVYDIQLPTLNQNQDKTTFWYEANHNKWLKEYQRQKYEAGWARFTLLNK